MTDEIEKKITIKYSQTGLNQMTREMQTYDRATHKITNSFQKWDDANKIYITQKNITKDATKQMGLFGGSVNQVIGRFIGIGAAIGLASKGFQELKQWVSTSIKEFRSFEIKMAEVSSILTTSTRTLLPSLEVGISSLSVKYGKSVNDLTNGLYEIISAAFDIKDAMSLLNVVTKASIAGLTSVTGAVKTFTGVLNAYGLSVAHASKLSDELFEAVVRGNFTFGQLESSLGYVVPIAAEAGIAFEEIASAMTTATRQGQHIDSVTRGLGLLIQNIINPTKDAAEAARKYGIDMTATALRVNGLTGFLNQLSEATKKYGNQILPELIGNMRSLRVVMALTSDSGIKGYIEDMDLMDTATGRTNEALTQIMATQQKLADVIEQTMERINRSVGKAWSGMDLWWKKTQVWWGSLLSGKNPVEAVNAIDKQIAEIQKNAYQGMVEPVKTTGPSLFDSLFGKNLPKTSEEFSKILKDTGKFGKMKEYLDLTNQIEGLSKSSLQADRAKLAFSSLAHELESKNYKDIYQGKTIMERPNLKISTFVDPKVLKDAQDMAKELGISFNISGENLDYYYSKADEVSRKTDELASKLEMLNNIQISLQPSIDDITTAFEDAKSAMYNYDQNIITINSDIEKLGESLPDLKQKLLELEVSSPLDRFQHYADLAVDYGEKYINEYVKVFDEYGNNMADTIKIIYEYNKALGEEKKATKEVEKANNDLEIAMAKNNLQMLKLQLAGMMRRRGNTRAEQRQMKQLEIANTKLRIEQMQNELKEQESSQKDALDAKEIAADRAKEILAEYLAAERNNLYEIQDTRDADIQDLKDTIKEQEDLLKTRKKMLKEQTKDSITLQSQYDNALTAIGANPKTHVEFEKTTGIQLPTPTAPNVYQNFMQRMGVKPLGPKQQGTHFIPETGFYKLHKYESVNAAGKETTASSNSIIVNINSPQISNDYDVAKMARTLENTLRANLIDKRTGKTKYRMM
jgi:TP901 family phage tail tape measure protein